MDTIADETQPLLRNEILHPKHTRNAADAETVVDFDPAGDSENPMDWPKAYKWSIVALLAATAFTVYAQKLRELNWSLTFATRTFTCISVVPVANKIVEDIDGHHASKSASVLLVTIWELGEAAGPLFIAPLSEVFGRKPVMAVANILFVGASLLAAFSPTGGVMVFARFLTGLAVASNVLNPAIVGDMFVSEERGGAMSLIMLAPLVGGAIGPAISGAIAQTFGWRPIFYICAALAGLLEILFLFLFRETFKVPILNRRAARMRKETGNLHLRTTFETEEEQKGRLWESVMRPFIVMMGSGVLQAMSIFGSVTFTFFYVMSTTLPDILQGIYGLSPAETGFAFVSFSIGSIISVVICNRLLDPIYVRLRDTHKGAGQPEYRLPLVILGGFSLPIMITLYGWSAQLHVPLVVLLIVVGIMGSSLMLGFLPLMSYVVDAFGLYSASAMTAVIVTRCLMGTFLPLLAEPLVERVGYGSAFTILGVFSLALAPIPVLVMRYGQKWRQGCKYSRED